MRSLAPMLAILALGCAPPEPLAFRVVSGIGADDDPWFGADRVAIRLEQNDQGIAETEQLFALDAPEWRLDGLPFGRHLRLEVEARGGDIVLARGHSFPFDRLEDDAIPVARADVLLGTVGNFARTANVRGPIAEIYPLPDGAIWVTTDGELVRYVAHGEDGNAQTEPLARGPADARWVAIGGIGLLAVDGDSVALFGPAGALLATATDPRLLRHGAGAALVSVDGAVLLVGGDDAGVPGSLVTRIEPRGAGISLIALEDLPNARSGHVARAVIASDRGGAELERVLCVGGMDASGPRTDAVLIDPLGVDPTAPSDPTLADLPSAGAALGPLAPGLVAVIGGDGVSDVALSTVTLLTVESRSVRRLIDLRVGLVTARRDAAIVELREGLLLVVGGTGGPASAPVELASAELVLAVGTGLVAEVRATGLLPAPIGHPSVVRLADSSAIVVGDAYVAAYFDPSGS